VQKEIEMNIAGQVFVECDKARTDGTLIKRVSSSDKEFHFQNWVRDRLDGCSFDYDEPGRNVYPDFRLVRHAVGFEVKGLAWPGRDANYDANSQVPTGWHNGREVFYVFGRYPRDVKGMTEYPVTDLVVCHGDFLNADHDYVHKNKSFRGFGSYGDVMVRDRKMYVVPTPFFLASGTTGLSTLILPADQKPEDPRLVVVGELQRVEVDQVVSAYEFNLETNDLVLHYSDNPNAGKTHAFIAYRMKGHGDDKEVRMNIVTSAVSLDDDDADDE
jgi:hypothetical protein